MSDYGLARRFFVWLDASGPFTPGELADAMGIDDEMAIRFTRVGTFPVHGGDRRPILEDTGDRVNGTYRGEEPLYRYIPIEEPNPRNHPHHLPEWVATPGCGALAPPNRGMPVRVRSDRDSRHLMSTAGSRAAYVQRERAYEKMMAAYAAQKEKARIRAQIEKDIGNAKKRQRDPSLPR